MKSILGACGDLTHLRLHYKWKLLEHKLKYIYLCINSYCTFVHVGFSEKSEITNRAESTLFRNEPPSDLTNAKIRSRTCRKGH